MRRGLAQVHEVVPGVQADHVLDGLVAALGVDRHPRELGRPEGLDHAQVGGAQRPEERQGLPCVGPLVAQGAAPAVLVVPGQGRAVLGQHHAQPVAPFSGPNEGLHYEHVALLRRDLRPPDPAASTRMDERHQPPLYYWTAAVAAWRHPEPKTDREFPGNPHFLGTHRGNLNPKVHADPSSAPALYSARLASLAFGALGLIATYWAACLWLPGSAALLAVALLAFHPAWLHLSVTCSNDLAVAAMCALVLAWATRLALGRNPEEPPDATDRDWLILGLLMSLALLTKASAIFLATVVALLCLDLWRRERPRTALRAGTLSILGWLPLSLAWWAYGRSRGMGLGGVERSVPVDRLISLRPADFLSLREEAWTLWRSVWMDWSVGDVGFGPDALYWGIAGLAGLAGIGWLRGGPWNGASRRRFMLALHVVWALGFLTVYLGVKALMLREMGYLTAEGRWILPLAPSLTVLGAAGLQALVAWAPWGKGLALLPTLAGGLLAVTWTPVLYPQADFAPGAASPDLPIAVYDDALALIGVSAPTMTVGEPAEIRMRWRTLANVERDYSVVLQLLADGDEHDRVYDAQASYPGLGSAPSAGWPADTNLSDTSYLRPAAPDGPRWPVMSTLTLSVVDLEADRTLRPSSTRLSDWGRVQDLPLYPAEALEIPETLRLWPGPHYDGKVELGGVDWQAEARELRLWWRALSPVREDWTVFVHALAADGAFLGQADGPADAGRSPTRIWRAGDVVQDTRRLEMEGAEPASLLIGWYRPENGARLPATLGGTGLPDEAYRIDLR